MKYIGASIMTLAGAFLMVGGAYARTDGAQAFLMFAGCVVVLTGLGGWIMGKEK
jgi:drug/metabolite transporter (DMT)-like permease